MDITHKPGTGPLVTKFRPSKRIKALHRRTSGSTPLRAIARAAAEAVIPGQDPAQIAIYKSAAVEWFANKRAA